MTSQSTQRFFEPRILLKKRNCVVFGLLWEPLESNDPSLISLRAQSRKATHYFCHHAIPENTYEIGSVESLEPGHLYYSAAVLTLHAIGDSHLALFQVTEKEFWVIAFWQGMVVPSSDVIFKNLDEATARFKTLEGLFNWNQKIFQPDLSVESSDSFQWISDQWQFSSELALTSIYDSKIKQRKKLEKLSFFISILAFIFSTFKIAEAFCQHRIDKMQEQIKLAQQQKEEKNIWRKIPLAQEFLKTGLDKLSDASLQKSGWKLNSGSFDGHSVSLIYKKTSLGTHQRLIDGTKKTSQKLEFLSQSKESARLKEVCVLSSNRANEKLPPISERYALLQDLLEHRLITGKLGTIQSLEGYKTCDFTFSSSTNPKYVFSSMPLNGLSFNVIGFSIGSSGKIVWNFSGRIYGI